MKKKIKKIIILLLILLLVGCGKSYKTLTAEEAKHELSLDSSIIVVDVRSKYEYEELKIDASISIPLDELENRANKELSNKNARIFIICRTGIRSKEASRLLTDMGYKNIYNIGGIEDWAF